MNYLKLSKILNRHDFHHTSSFAREPFCFKKGGGESSTIFEFYRPIDSPTISFFHLTCLFNHGKDVTHSNPPLVGTSLLLNLLPSSSVLLWIFSLLEFSTLIFHLKATGSSKLYSLTVLGSHQQIRL